MVIAMTGISLTIVYDSRIRELSYDWPGYVIAFVSATLFACGNVLEHKLHTINRHATRSRMDLDGTGRRVGLIGFIFCCLCLGLLLLCWACFNFC